MNTQTYWNNGLAGWLTLAIILLATSLNAQGVKKYTDKDGTVKYRLNEGRLDAAYTSYYPNGQKKSEGVFDNNCRTGKWTVWNAEGVKKAERNYTTPFNFDRIYPPVSTDDPVPVLAAPIYEPVYNNKGYIDYFQLEERMVVWLKRIWQDVESADNPVLFKDELLLFSLKPLLLDGTVKAYSTKDDMFTTEIPASELSFADAETIRYKIKEEWFYDNERFVMESRILGICPVIVRNGVPEELCWIYYPELREHLAKVSLKDFNVPAHITHLDDLFFYRHFAGIITKESNVYDRSVADFKTGAEARKETERIWLNLIETEHRLWIDRVANPE